MRNKTHIFIQLLMRDGPTCHICGQEEDRSDPFEIEHIVPKAAKGSDDLTNLGLAHRSCNRAKGSKAIGSKRAI